MAEHITAGSVCAQLPQVFKHKVLPPGVNVWHRTPTRTNREKWASNRDGTREGAVNPTQVPDGPTEKWQEVENNMPQAEESNKEFRDRRTASTPASVRVVERIYLKNFTREDGLDAMYQGPYQVLENVMIERENGRTSWVHLDHCKVVHLQLTEHLVRQNDTTQVSGNCKQEPDSTETPEQRADEDGGSDNH